MDRFEILGKELLDDAKNVEFSYNKNGSLYEIYDQLLETYCYPIRGMDQYNLMLGTGHEERYWKWKRIEEAKKKRGQIKEERKETDYKSVAKRFIDLVDDAAVSSTKKINLPSENLTREAIGCRSRHFYLDLCEQLYYSLADKTQKDEIVDFMKAEKDQDFIETMYDFTHYLLNMERVSEEAVKVELSEALKELVMETKKCIPKYLRLLILDEISILMFNEYAVKIEEQEEYINEAIELLRQAADIMADFTDTVNEVYVGFSELLYRVIFDKTEGNVQDMIALLKVEIENTKQILKIEKKEDCEQLGYRIFSADVRKEDDTLYQTICALL